MEIGVSSIEGQQLDLCKGDIIFYHVDCFCLQEKHENEGEAFCVPSTEVTASAKKIKALLGMFARLPWGRRDMSGSMNGKMEECMSNMYY